MYRIHLFGLVVDLGRLAASSRRLHAAQSLRTFSAAFSSVSVSCVASSNASQMDNGGSPLQPPSRRAPRPQRSVAIPTGGARRRRAARRPTPRGRSSRPPGACSRRLDRLTASSCRATPRSASRWSRAPGRARLLELEPENWNELRGELGAPARGHALHISSPVSCTSASRSWYIATRSDVPCIRRQAGATAGRSLIRRSARLEAREEAHREASASARSTRVVGSSPSWSRFRKMFARLSAHLEAAVAGPGRRHGTATLSAASAEASTEDSAAAARRETGAPGRGCRREAARATHARARCDRGNREATRANRVGHRPGGGGAGGEVWRQYGKRDGHRM